MSSCSKKEMQKKTSSWESSLFSAEVTRNFSLLFELKLPVLREFLQNHCFAILFHVHPNTGGHAILEFGIFRGVETYIHIELVHGALVEDVRGHAYLRGLANLIRRRNRYSR